MWVESIHLHLDKVWCPEFWQDTDLVQFQHTHFSQCTYKILGHHSYRQIMLSALLDLRHKSFLTPQIQDTLIMKAKLCLLLRGNSIYQRIILAPSDTLQRDACCTATISYGCITALSMSPGVANGGQCAEAEGHPLQLCPKT